MSLAIKRTILKSFKFTTENIANEILKTPSKCRQNQFFSVQFHLTMQILFILPIVSTEKNAIKSRDLIVQRVFKPYKQDAFRIYLCCSVNLRLVYQEILQN